MTDQGRGPGKVSGPGSLFVRILAPASMSNGLDVRNKRKRRAFKAVMRMC
jgi:hypothetical protein